MKKTETGEETLERLGKGARSGIGVAKRVETLAKRVTKTPRPACEETAKA